MESQNDKVVEEDGLEKLATLEEKIRAIEGNNMYDPVKAVEMRLVPNVIILKMFSHILNPIPCNPSQIILQ